MAASPKEVRVYETSDGRRPFDEWLDGLRDKSTIARIASRLNRVALGNMGDAKSVGGGVSELRLAFGPGFRIYFAQDGDKIILLLCGGDKGSQVGDIRTAKTYLEDYKRRGHGKKK
jgi:putative addiction module killer protein